MCRPRRSKCHSSAQRNTHWSWDWCFVYRMSAVQANVAQVFLLTKCMSHAWALTAEEVDGKTCVPRAPLDLNCPEIRKGRAFGPSTEEYGTTARLTLVSKVMEPASDTRVRVYHPAQNTHVFFEGLTFSGQAEARQKLPVEGNDEGWRLDVVGAGGGHDT